MDIGLGVSPIEVGPTVVEIKGVVPKFEDVLGVASEVRLVDIGVGDSLLDGGFAVVPWVDIKCVVLRLVWEVPLVDIGLGVSSLDVCWMIVEVVPVVSGIVVPLVVGVFIGNGVSPLIEGDELIGTVVDSFSGVCCIVCVFWVVFGVSFVCNGVGLS